jgi:hypothetical protein
MQFLEDNPRVYLTLPPSKTDPFRLGITIPTTAALDAACPVKALRYLFEKYPMLPFSPLFSLDRDSTGARTAAAPSTTATNQLSLAPTSSARFLTSCLRSESRDSIPGIVANVGPQRGPAPLAFGLQKYSSGDAGTRMLFSALLKSTLRTSTTTPAACRPCCRPLRAASCRLATVRHKLGPWPVWFWEELSAASLPHPRKQEEGV